VAVALVVINKVGIIMFDSFFFYLSAFLTCAGALLVVFERNLMHSCVYLLMSLIGVAGLYFTLEADFIGATQLVVYVGGVVILMLFAVMLTGGGIEGKKDRLANLLSYIPPMGNVKSYIWGGFTSLLFLMISANTVFKITEVLEVKGDINIGPTVEQIGIKLLTDHVLMFELSSVLLLGALIGTAMISRPSKNNLTGNN
jgi:NADH-quinone oxidoreductase subunit J